MRIPNQVDALHSLASPSAINVGCNVKRLSRVERQQAAHRPSVCQQFPTRSIRQFIVEQGRKIMACVEIAVSIVALNVKAVLRRGSAVGGPIVKTLGPRGM